MTFSATLHNTLNNPLANALVDVTATNVGGGGQVLIDGSRARARRPMAARATPWRPTRTAARQFSVSGSEPGAIDVVVSYESQQIDKTTVQVTSGAKTVKVPGRATIAKLSPLVGGFELVVGAPASSGASPITSFQYSVTGGSRWISLVHGVTLIKVMHLTKGKTYHVIVRALNSFGAGASSTAKTIVTRR